MHDQGAGWDKEYVYPDARLDVSLHGGRMARQRLGLGRSDATQLREHENGVGWEARVPSYRELG